MGYTNAGKSTLFNRLTGADVYVENRLFATLDPTLRRVELPEIGPIILAELARRIYSSFCRMIWLAFQATLEEVAEADLLTGRWMRMTVETSRADITQLNTVLSQHRS